MDDLISRKMVLALPRNKVRSLRTYEVIEETINVTDIEHLPPAQPEPAIPLQWIETQIEWLKSLDNAFSTLTAVQISAMVNKWKDEQDD